MHFTAFCRSAEATDENEVIKVEIHAEKQHENGYHPLAVRAVACNTVRFYAEAARSRSAEGVQERVEERHATAHEQDRLQHRHGDVDKIKDLCRVAYARDELADDGTGHFGAHDVYRAARFGRDYRHHEHEYAHAADPVREASPEEYPVAHCLNIGDNGGAGRRKTADRFKKCVDIRRYLA